MKMRSIPILIDRARGRTHNEDHATNLTTGKVTEGIGQNVCVEFLNDAQDHIASLYTQNNSSLFIKEYEFNITADTQAYDIDDDDVFMNAKILSVQRNESLTSDENWQDMDQLSLQREYSSGTGTPKSFIRRAGQILLVPTPDSSTGRIRVQYRKTLPRLDIVRAIVDGTPAGTDIDFDATEDIHAYDIENGDYICICNKSGTILLQGGIVESYTAPTLTLAANVDTYLNTGYVLADLDGMYVTLGAYSSIVSELPLECERYLKNALQQRLLETDVSDSAIIEKMGVQMIENDIISDVHQESEAIQFIPIIDEDIYI